MNRSLQSFTLSLLLLTVALASEAQQPDRAHRVGFLTSASDAHSLSTRVPGQLALLGWKEDDNVRFHFAAVAGTDKRLEELAKQLVATSDVVVASDSAAVRAARSASGTIPIVSVFDEDPIQSGFVASLGRPGTNVTGIALPGTELAGKRVELIRELVPRLSQVAVLWNPTAPGAQRQGRAVQAAAETLGVNVLFLETRGPAELEQAFVTARRRGVGALLVVTNEAWMRSQALTITRLAAQASLPALYPNRYWTDPPRGGLTSYGEDPLDISQGIAKYVDRILKGALPGNLPVERPAKFELVINRKAAVALGLTIPPSFLVRADRIIE